jgi:hypothetical protein
MLMDNTILVDSYMVFTKGSVLTFFKKGINSLVNGNPEFRMGKEFTMTMKATFSKALGSMECIWILKPSIDSMRLIPVFYKMLFKLLREYFVQSSP